MHFWKLINIFHKEHLEKPTVTFLLLNSTLLMARSTVPKEQLKQKRSCANKKVNKRGKNKTQVVINNNTLSNLKRRYCI